MAEGKICLFEVGCVGNHWVDVHFTQKTQKTSFFPWPLWHSVENTGRMQYLIRWDFLMFLQQLQHMGEPNPFRRKYFWGTGEKLMSKMLAPHYALNSENSFKKPFGQRITHGLGCQVLLVVLVSAAVAICKKNDGFGFPKTLPPHLIKCFYYFWQSVIHTPLPRVLKVLLGGFIF